MAALLIRTLNRLHSTLLAIGHAAVTAVFVFWCIQLVLWMCMMIYVQFFNQKLGQSVLYVTQISHWALVEAAGTAALSSWALLQSKRNQRRLEEIQRDEKERRSHAE